MPPMTSTETASYNHHHIKLARPVRHPLQRRRRRLIHATARGYPAPSTTSPSRPSSPLRRTQIHRRRASRPRRHRRDHRRITPAAPRPQPPAPSPSSPAAHHSGGAFHRPTSAPPTPPSSASSAPRNSLTVHLHNGARTRQADVLSGGIRDHRQRHVRQARQLKDMHALLMHHLSSRNRPPHAPSSTSAHSLGHLRPPRTGILTRHPRRHQPLNLIAGNARQGPEHRSRVPRRLDQPRNQRVLVDIQVIRRSLMRRKDSNASGNDLP